MSNLALTEYDTYESSWNGPAGRHALDEEAVLTPIFHALTRGGLRSRRSEPGSTRPAAPSDPVETFRRDPLTAPIPVQALMPVPSRSWRRAQTEPSPAGSGRRRAGRGRHHRRLEVVGY